MPRQVRVLKHVKSSLYVSTGVGTNPSINVFPVDMITDDYAFWAVDQSADGRGTTFQNMEARRYLDIQGVQGVASKAAGANTSWVVEVGDDRSLYVKNAGTGEYLTYDATKKGFFATGSKTDNEAFAYEDVERRILKEGTGVFVVLTKDPRVGVKMEIDNDNTFTLKLKADFSNSKNLKVVTRKAKLEGDTVATASVNPGERIHLVDLQVVGTPWRWGWSSSWAWETPPPAVAAARQKENAETIEKEMADIKKVVGSETDPVKQLQLCKAAGLKWIDLSYPPNDSSLYLPSRAAAERGGTPLQWRRPHDFMTDGSGGPDETGEPVVFNQIEPGDIAQGYLGDCWYLCALAVLAEYPKVVENLIPVDDDDIRDGQLKVYFCKDGWWTLYYVDTYLPCWPSRGPAYAKNKQGELWVSLLEKAYAKVNGCYQNIVSGLAGQALSDLTGFPYKWTSVPSCDKEKLWAELVEGESKKYYMACSTPGKDTSAYAGDKDQEEQALSQRYKDAGFVTGHAYSIINVKALKNGNDTLRLLQLRNPWGKFEWKGDWSDDSPLWTDKLKAEVNLKKADDGTFWMAYEQFVEFFVGVTICLHQPDWYEVRAQGTFADGGLPDFCTEVYVKKSGPVIVSLHQKDRRSEGTTGDMQYAELCLAVLRPVTDNLDNTYEILQYTGMQRSRDVFLELGVLDPGENDEPYLIIGTSTAAKSMPFVLSVNAQQTFQFKHRQVSPELLQAVDKSVVRKLGKAKEIDANEKCTMYYNMANRSAGFLCENLGDKVWNFKIDFTKSTGVKSDAEDGRLKFVVECPPKSMKMVCQLLATEAKWKVSWSYAWRFLNATGPVVDNSRIIIDCKKHVLVQRMTQIEGQRDKMMSEG